MRSRTRTALTALLPLLAVAACTGPAAEEPGGSSPAPTSSPSPSPTPSQDPGAPQEQHLPEEPQPTITSGEPIMPTD